jgi:hypothetical protein
MPFQGVVVEPAELAKLARAFDAAWMAVNSVNTVGGQQQRRAGARRQASFLISGGGSRSGSERQRCRALPGIGPAQLIDPICACHETSRKPG